MLERFDKPFLCAFSDGDPITGGGDRMLIGKIPGAAGQPHTTLAGAGHFLQEDRGPELAGVVADWVHALTERESARRLARLGGTEPDVTMAPRRRVDGQ